jgi:L-fuculokinase
MLKKNATLVLDIGKTNVKLVLIDFDGKQLAEQRSPNTIVADGPYPHHDTERIMAWMLATMGGLARIADIGAIVPVTHGATAALVDADGLVLPVLDYEFTPPDDGEYLSVRPAFTETLSPALPAGLNLGRQLAWQAGAFPGAFARATQLLMYPQYWAWRLCGVAASEVTSLGCHTDLWDPRTRGYSSLVSRMGWSPLLPPMRNAWDALGAIKPELAALTGLPADCQVLCGVHDSNASLLRYLASDDSAASPTVLSSGTWLIAAALGAPLGRLVEADDMLANTNVLNEPVPCMRFMGGREFAALAGADAAACSEDDLARVVAQRSFAMPCFAPSGGPFSGKDGHVLGPLPTTDAERTALATLYCVLMSDYCLSALGSTGPVVVEGPFTGNPFFSPLLAALRPGQALSQSDDASGTACGAWMLHHWGRKPEGTPASVEPLLLAGLRAYRDQWRASLP